MKKGERFAGGLQLQFFPHAEFEEPNLSDPVINAEIIARNVLRVLLMGNYKDWQKLSNWKVFKAIFIRRDRELMKGLRIAFQQGFQFVYEQLKEKKLPPLEHEQALLFISNCLTLLPYADLNPYESIALPQWIKGSWQLIEYKVSPIELTPTHGFQKLILEDTDRVFAYGLEPILEKDASPQLIFMGTTYPAGQGFVTQVNTDMEAFATVGNQLYHSGKKNLTKWISGQQQPIEVCGTSLGGSLALLFAIDKGEKASRITALNPAGLLETNLKKTFDNWDSISIKPIVIVEKQNNDPVSQFGIWKKEWNLIHVIPTKAKQGPNQLSDHALNYTGFSDTQFIILDPISDNNKRQGRNFWLYTVLRSFIYYAVLTPFRYFIRPVGLYLLNHKLQVLISCFLIVLIGLFPALSLGSAFSIFMGLKAFNFLNSIISGLILGFGLERSISFILGKLGIISSDSSIFLDWIKQRGTPFKVIFGLTLGLALTSLSVGLVLSTGLLMPALFGLASMPLSIYLVEKTIFFFKTILGKGRIKAPACQDPQLERNIQLDIYQNEAEVSFTPNQINNYYSLIRCDLKNKKFVPEPKENELKRFSGLTKFEILKKLSNGEPVSDVVTLTATKAKIFTMTKTVELIEKFGLCSKKTKKMASALEEAYQLGKEERKEQAGIFLC